MNDERMMKCRRIMNSERVRTMPGNVLVETIMLEGKRCEMLIDVGCAASSML